MVDLAWSCDVLLCFRDGEDAVLSLVVVFLTCWDVFVYVTMSFCCRGMGGRFICFSIYFDPLGPTKLR